MKVLVCNALMFLFLVGSVFACLEPYEGMTIEQSAQLCEGHYVLEEGITIVGNNIEVTCDNTNLVGVGSGTGVRLVGADMKITNCHIQNYTMAIDASDASGVIENNELSDSYLGVRYAPHELTLQSNVFVNVVESDDTLENTYYPITGWVTKEQGDVYYVGMIMISSIALFATLFFAGRFIEEFRRDSNR